MPECAAQTLIRCTVALKQHFGLSFTFQDHTKAHRNCKHQLAAVLAGMGLVGQKEGFDAEKIKDRVYKLENNKQQNRCDHFAYGGAVIGSALSCLRGEPGSHLTSISVGPRTSFKALP